MTAAADVAGIPAHLVGFVEALRRRGIAVGPSETVDAGAVLSVLDLLDREAVREGLACSLVRRPSHRPAFDALFDLWFPAAIGARTADEDAVVAPPRRDDGSIDLDALKHVLADLLADGSDEAMAEVRRLVGDVVETYGKYSTARGDSFSEYQTLREVAPDTLLARIVEGLRGRSRDPGAPTSGDFESELVRRTAAVRVAEFRSMIEKEVRRRTAEVLGRERVASYGVPRAAEDVDFLRASEAELAALRRQMVPLARILAGRLAVRRRRSRAGSIDLRRTLRRSMSTGGVPVTLVTKAPRRARPDLVVLCDVSGSVAGFSQFTLSLVHTLREQFSRVRVFAFVDTVDEVTRFFSGPASAGVTDAVSRMIAEADLVSYDGHSDYGHSFESFAMRHLPVVTPRSSLLVLGDARTNFRDPRVESLARAVAVARHAHWLNPEPRAQWGTGDSAAEVYRRVIPMHECRSASQLADVVGRLLPAT
ncbi:vWA domain-containing protein [Rhodococcoides corynebacterioides]|uniref:vWA domain-containing protein n=1 Tax=Rhodococcoides corynebacterioides TaxID=53972 RepID=UPI001C9B50A0|nr:VWA domain-containing protein [Rhodococcus corynebacterioides]MBY6349688.1 VWA domain-containing protein [Rhodococcus corynebacterioides]